MTEYRRLWDASQKQGGERNLFDFLIYRRISTLALSMIARYRFSPNYVTLCSIAASLVASLLFFSSETYSGLVLGVIWMNFSLVLDTLDGQYARYTNQQSEFGGWFDGVSDCLKYIFLFFGICCGAYYHPYLEQQFLNEFLVVFAAHEELLLISGMWIISNLFMIYYVHASRYRLSKNPERIVKLKQSNRSDDKRFHFGIESTLYVVFTIFIVFGQTYWLLVFLSLTLPILWILPCVLVARRYSVGSSQ